MIFAINFIREARQLFIDRKKKESLLFISYSVIFVIIDHHCNLFFLRLSIVSENKSNMLVFLYVVLLSQALQINSSSNFIHVYRFSYRFVFQFLHLCYCVRLFTSRKK